MLRQRRARILATLGPSSSTPEQIYALALAGADVFRLNFSHGSHDDHAARYDAIRSVERDIGRPFGVLMDLQGPKLRVGRMAGGRALLETGSRFQLDLDPADGTAARAGMPPRASLDNNDAHTFFGVLGDSLITGPTLTNVNDFRAIYVA